MARDFCVCDGGTSGASHPRGAHPTCFRRAGRLKVLLNQHIVAVTKSAYISTLGGGYFLCDMLVRARAAATAQLRIAVSRGDLASAGRCVMHLVYADIKEAKFGDARTKIQAARRIAQQTGVRVCKHFRTLGSRHPPPAPPSWVHLCTGRHAGRNGWRSSYHGREARGRRPAS